MKEGRSEIIKWDVENTTWGSTNTGSFSVKKMIPRFRISEGGIKGVLPIDHLNKTLHTIAYGIEGRIKIQIYKC